MTRIATFDIETDGLLDNVTRMWCGTIMDHATLSLRSYGPDEIVAFLADLSSYDTAIGHNVIEYDFVVLSKLYGFEFKGKVLDTLVISRLQNPFRIAPPTSTGGPHSIESWGIRLGHRKVGHEDWSQYSPEMLHRNQEDVRIQHQLWYALEKERNESGYRWLHGINLTCRLLRLLQQQAAYGWTVDQGHIDHSIARLTRWADRIHRAVLPRLPLVTEAKETKKAGEFSYVKAPFKKDGSYSKAVVDHMGDYCAQVCGPYSRVTFRPVDLDSSAEIKQFLLDQGWVPDQWNTNKQTGERTTPKLSKDDPFLGVKGSLGRLIVRRVQCKQRRGILQGWQEKIRPDGRIATRHTGLATTMRLKHADIVNVPSAESGAFFGKEMRKVFVAKPGWVMVGVDSKGNQQRQLLSRLKLAEDHPFAWGILHGKKEDGTDEHSALQRAAHLPNRTLAKNLFYGTVFGAQDRRISLTLSCTMEQAKDYRQRVLTAVPGLDGLIDELVAEWLSTAGKKWNTKLHRVEPMNGTVTGIDGRPIFIEHKHAVLVYMLQSDEAIQMTVAYCWFHSEMAKRGYEFGKDWGMLIWYHDEFQFEVRPDIATECAALAEESVAWAGRYLRMNVPHAGEAKIGLNWAETH